MDRFIYSRVTSSGVVKDSKGVVHAICINDPGSTVTMTVFDNPAAASGNIIWQGVLTTGQPPIILDVVFKLGLYINLSGAAAVTVSFL